MNRDDLEKPMVVSYCNHKKEDKYENTMNLISTLESNDWDYQIIGEGDKWNGFYSKIIGYRDFLKEMNPEKIIVLIDAHDVLCVRSSIRYMEHFKKYNKKIVVSMELFAESNMSYNFNKSYYQTIWLGPYFQYYNIDPEKIVNKKKYVNSGLISGYARDLYDFLNWSIENNYQDDQYALGAYMNLNPEKIYADIHAQLLHTSGFGVNNGLHHEEQINDSVTIAELLGKKAFFIHIPGLNGSKGQKYMYNGLVQCVKIFHSKKMKELYPQYDHDYFEKYHEK